MTPVPSTPTASDKFEEVRKLNVEIAALKVEQEHAKRATEIAFHGLKDAQERLKTLNEGIQHLEQKETAVAQETAKFTEFCKQLIRETAESVENALENAKLVAVRVQELTDEIAKSEQKLEDHRATISRETLVLTRQKNDLDIYHRRILKAAEEHLPGQKVVI